MALEDTSAPAPALEAGPPPEPPPPPPVDAEARAREAARGRARRAKEREKRAKLAAPAELEPQPQNAAATGRPPGPSPERIAAIARRLDKALEDTAATLAGALEAAAPDSVAIPADVARGTCAALSQPDARHQLAEAWAPLVAELAPDDGPPNPWAAAVIGSLAFGVAVAANTFAIRNARDKERPSA